MQTGFRFWLAALMAPALALPTAIRAAPLGFELPRQPLIASIRQVAAAGGLRVDVPRGLADGRTAPALRGRFEPVDAMRRLLRGSGLVVAMDHGTLRISDHAEEARSVGQRTPLLAPVNPRLAAAPAASLPDQTPAGVPLVAQMTQPPGSTNPIYDYMTDWQARVEQAQASQPHWMTPLVTVTPRLEQEVRYDQYWEQRGNGSTLDIFDSGKGLELIPTTSNEVLINPPAYQYKGNTKHPANGWLDDQFLVVKQRFTSANEQNGNYIVSGFLGITAASGNAAFTNKTWIVSPTIAAGKGWGDFDVQATLGAAIPFKNQSTLGTAIPINISFQYHLLTYLWPEFEVNDTYWADGKERGGKDQVLLTPGIIFGRLVIHDRIKAIIGGGYQVAVSPHYADTTEQTPAYNHAWILSARVAF